MMIAESRRGRRLVGRLDRGVELLEGLAQLCQKFAVRTGEIRALGALEQVVLGEYDQRARQMRPPRRFDAQFEILHLYGNVSERDGKLFLRAGVTLSRERDNGIELVGGQLISARAFAVEFVIETFDDLLLRRLPDAQTGLPLWRDAIPLDGGAEPVAAAPPAPVPFEAPATTSWNDVIRASEARERPAPAPEVTDLRAPVPDLPDRVVHSGEEEAHAVPGDYIEHPKFGRMQVERIEGDYEFVSARLRNQRLIRLSLDVITLTKLGEEDGHQLFRAETAR
jgi:predicted DNA-binding protein with PD1-like motif